MTNSRIRLLFLICGALLLSLTFGCKGGGSSGFDVSKVLVSIEVAPVNPIVALGTTRQFTATGIFSDNSNQDITASVTWSSSSTAAATVSNAASSNGLATAVAAGSTTITATSGGVSGSTMLTVKTLVSIQVAPTNPSIALGTTRQFTATGIFADNTSQDITASVTWSSASTAVATISNTAGSNGLAMAFAAGSTVISATLGTISGSSTLIVTPATLVSVQVAPTNPSIALGTTRQFIATGIFSDNTSQDITASVTWSSASTAVATISNTTGSNGLATAVAAGSTVISATSGTISGSTTLTVTSATLVSIQVDPTNPSIAPGTTRQFIATGIFSDHTNQDITASVTWSSSSTAVATISNTAGSNGLATAVAAGSTVISATSGTISGSTTLTVTTATLVSIQVAPANPSIALNTTGHFTATGIYSDNSHPDITASVIWSSSSTTVATVDSNGLATGVAVGSTVISATLGTIAGSTTLTVTPATLVSIDVTTDDGISDPSIAFGMQQNFIATGTYSDNTTVNLTASVIWSSSSTTVATVDSNGLATAVSAGSTLISATSGTISGSTTLTVTPASVALVSIALTPSDPSVSFALPEQFYATGIYSDGSSEDLTPLVTWVSSDTGVATISNDGVSKGQATPVAPGTTTITAWFEGVSGTSTLTVTPATLTSITISSATTTIALGTTQQFTATGTFTDGTTQDITASVLWTSSDSSVATISITGATTGLATAVGAGTTIITTALGSVTNATTVTLTVTTATLNTISIAPSNATIFLGAPAQFTATGNFSDGSSQDLTTQVTWKSAPKTIATVSNTAGSKGLVTPIKAGLTTISATLAGTSITGSTPLTVSSATLTSIVVTPVNPSVRVGKTLQFTATGFYPGGLQQDLTRSTNLTWSSSDKTIATIANVPKKNKGLATGVRMGSVTIKAQMKGSSINDSTTLTVNP